jgi:hypothetical protein
MTSIRDAVPENLARWLDAQSVEGEKEFGYPGFNELRLAWVGRIPEKDVLPLIEPWLNEREQLQYDSEFVYSQLFLVEPVERTETGEITVPAWIAEWWSQVLTSQPWDERLGEAITAARNYLADRGVELPAAPIEQALHDAADDGN